MNGANLAVGVVYTNRDFELYEVHGDLLYRLTLDAIPKAMASTNHYDDIKVSFVSPDNNIKIYSLSMEKAPANFTVIPDYQGL